MALRSDRANDANVVLGISGGIAAYKAVELLRLLTSSGHRVRVVPTRSALRFVGEATLRALSGQPVATDVFDDADLIEHVRLGRGADLVIVAPATAHTLARAAHGFADDLLTNVLLTAQCPVLYAPAMHTEMWHNPATAANVAILASRGAVMCGPDSGALAGGDVGEGRLASPGEIAQVALLLLDRRRAGRQWRNDLVGRRVVVSAGGTREPLDPVRFLGNRSSGRQGLALARVAAARGADVTVVAANVGLDPPPGVRLMTVSTTEQLRRAMLTESRGSNALPPADVVIMAAAPADFQPVVMAAHKIKKIGDGVPQLELRRTPDVLAELVVHRVGDQVIVGFAAETGDSEADARTHAVTKLKA
ncbi:MAG: bifunctional phosphopantothenoylcysteine decarboxylase/phosphopantothenate--cysteine ligase CoaBC, partial [Mycobacteriales bacterium]